MIELVDAYIDGRLKVITFMGQAVTVYDYDPMRDQGETQFPCIAFMRQPIVIGDDGVRPDSYYYTADAEETEITIPRMMGGGTEIGPVTYTRKPYPIPIDLSYEIQALATNSAHATKLIESIYAVLPQKHQVEISGQFPLFIATDFANLDEREKPLYVNSFILEVYDLWIDRFEAETYQSIREIEFTEDTE